MDESTLYSLTREELVFVLYQVFQGLLEDTPTPAGGHPGVQEAIIAERLGQAHASIRVELDSGDELAAARAAAWDSILRLLPCPDEDGQPAILPLNERGLDWQEPLIYRSQRMSADLWEELLLDPSGLWGEFRWDTDWQHPAMLDLPEEQTRPARECMGFDMDVVHQMPHTPTPAEVRMAEHYLRYLIWKDAARSPAQRS